MLKEITPEGKRGLCEHIVMDWSSCLGSLCLRLSE